ncbi:MAG TPA: hypothetical protein VGS21_05315 [Acidimicrobiales bacterium]|nr:hypothetical protein [Acidimicrobiales bacterium]
MWDSSRTARWSVPLIAAALVAISQTAVAGGALPTPIHRTALTKEYSLTSVSCPATNYCEAVGQTQIGTTLSGLAESWNGATWSAQAPALPAGASSFTLEGVTCAAVNSCIAVGYGVVSTHDYTLVETWNGTSWSIQSSPDVAGAAEDILSSVSCESATSCLAVGASVGPTPPWQTLAETWNGSTWTISPTPDMGTGQNTLSSVSCVPAYCSAVGSYYAPGGSSASTLDEAWSSGTWSVVATPNGSGSSTLSGVACASTTFCEAVGFEGEALIETWNGSTWSIAASPTRVGSLFGVSCVSPSYCVTVGKGPLAEVWNGSTWVVHQAIKPSTSTGAFLDSVSCPSATACMAVGTYYAPDKSLAETWNGRYWVRSPTKY